MPPAIPGTPEERDALAAAWSAHPGMRHLGARADFSDPERVRLILDPVRPEHRGGMGTTAVNGAVIASLFDAAIGMVGHFQLPGRRAGTAQLHIHFMRPVQGDRIEVAAYLARAGANLVFAWAEITDPEGRVCARADGIVAASGSAADDRSL
jgi:uncharacterized protein (TIGR00369 family)